LAEIPADPSCMPHFLPYIVNNDGIRYNEKIFLY
jgi:hypothetical protein